MLRILVLTKEPFMKVSAIGNPLTKPSGFALGLKRALVLLALLLGGCAVAETSSPSVPSRLDVPLPSVSLPGLRMPGQSAAISSISRDRAGDNVSISGRVTQRVAILEGWIYQINDDTGSLWVLAGRSDPIVGDIATVSGVIRHEAIMVDPIDASEVYLEEQSYRVSERLSQPEEN